MDNTAVRTRLWCFSVLFGLLTTYTIVVVFTEGAPLITARNVSVGPFSQLREEATRQLRRLGGAIRHFMGNTSIAGHSPRSGPYSNNDLPAPWRQKQNSISAGQQVQAALTAAFSRPTERTTVFPTRFKVSGTLDRRRRKPNPVVGSPHGRWQDRSETDRPPVPSTVVPHVTHTMGHSAFLPPSGTGPNLCPETPMGLVGQLRVNLDIKSWEQLTSEHPEVRVGGRWRPSRCHARYRVAILVPYRKRQEHLRIFLNNMHSFLQKQQLDYQIYVIEQFGDAPFNRGKLLNVGYKESLLDTAWDCAVFHDVDHIPMDDRNLYYCPSKPRHMAVTVDKLQYRLPYYFYFGGVAAMNKRDFETINGFSNMYWGWGAEDDDLYYRCVAKQAVPLLRYPPEIGRYHSVMAYHQAAEVNTDRFTLLNTSDSRQDTDGLNSLQYRLVRKVYTKLYTHIMADI